MNFATEYLRVRITGTLTCRSDFHLGDGGSAESNERPPQQGFVEMEKGSYNTVCTDAAGRPYLPGSSLRGALRAAGASEPEWIINCLFGLRERAGRVRFYDAQWHSTSAQSVSRPFWHASRKTCIRHGVAIDPVTYTADEHKLFQHELVPAGTKFDVTIEVDEPARAWLDVLLSLLTGWDGHLSCALGGGRGKGWGGVAWEMERVQVLTPDALARWLETDSADLPWDDLDVSSFKSEGQSHPSLSIALTLIPQGPFLVHEPGFQRAKESCDASVPDLEYDRTPDGHARIPGSTLRGWARARAHKIAATIAHQQFGASPEDAWNTVVPLIDELFGAERCRGRLWFTDARSTSPAGEHTQTFNAIDRFTGGVAQGALYQVRAADCSQLDASCTVDLGTRGVPEAAEKGILLFVLRDAMEGDLNLGWGQAKGYGAFTARVAIEGRLVNEWDELLTDLREKGYDPADWVTRLHDTVGQLVAKSRGHLGTAIAEQKEQMA